MPKLILLLTAQQIIQVSFQTFPTASLLGYNDINLSLLSYSKCFSNPSPMYHKISPKPVRQSNYFSSLTPIYRKIGPVPVRSLKYFSGPSSRYHKVNNLSPVRQSKIFQVEVAIL